MKKIYVSGELPRRFSEGFALLRDDLGFENVPDGFPVTLSAGDAITVQSLVGGAVTGLASTGLHQAFKIFVEKED